MEEMFRIGQVAKIYGISLDTLRLYEKKGLLIPYVCKDNQYRYYSVNQLDTLELILNSKNAGMSLNDIAEILSSENLSFYLNMFKKQEELLTEKIELLERTKKYTRKKIEVIEQILNFQNDYTFINEVQFNADDITLYLMDIKLLMKIGANTPQTEGMEFLETWRLFKITENSKALEDLETAIFSFQTSKEKSVLEKDFLKLYEKGLISKQKISHSFMKFSFFGTNVEMIQYVETIQNKVKLLQSNIYVKNCHTIINLKKENQYFIEIYLA